MLHWSLWCYKNSISRDFGKKSSYPNQITTPLKIQKEKIEGLWKGYHCLGMYELEYVL